MDPAAFRSRFPVLERIAYLNAGSDGPLPHGAVAAAREALDAQVTGGRTAAHFMARQEADDALREIYAARLGAPPEDVALTTSTSEGIGKVLVGLGLGPGDEVLTSDAEHPGLIGPLLAAKAAGVRVRTGPLETLADHVTDATTVVCCSHVGWVSGVVADPRLGELAIPVVYDGAQGVGAVPTDVQALGCAAYAGAGQKWLCGADGTGMLYLAPAWRDRIRALAPAYRAFTDASAGLASGLHDDARAHDTPTLALELAVASVAAAAELEAFGWHALHERAATLAETLAGELAEAGRTVAPRGRTTLVAWEDPDPQATAARVAEAGVVIRFLPGTPYLRASVGAWNDESDLDRLLEALS
jgi:selenocysteine lyase/cysteine desulfurase